MMILPGLNLPRGDGRAVLQEIDQEIILVHSGEPRYPQNRKADIAMNILLLEDSPSDALLARKALDHLVDFQLVHEEKLSAALVSLQVNSFDLVLLDLGLPDSKGLETLNQVYAQCGDDVAIVVLTGNEDESEGPQALRAGAQDYLQKRHLPNSEALRRCLFYAHERRRHLSEVKRLQEQVEQVRREEQRKRETDFWETMDSRMPASVSARMMGEQSLADRYPDIFLSLQSQYDRILDGALEQRIMKVNLSVSLECEQLAHRLGFLKAGARDVVELHRKVVRQKLDSAASLRKANACQEEARLRIVQLMGFLAMYYRNHPE